ncbi:MAG: methyltransferase domain-containing protein [Mariprofundaceae bacterium]
MKQREEGRRALREYARLAPAYDDRWSFYTEATIRETMKRLSLKPGERLLDVGCGTGALLWAVSAAFPDIEAAGVDPSLEMLRLARRKLPHRMPLEAGWAESLPFRDNSFDVVVSCSAFHYCRHPHAALAEAGRVLNPGGRIVITDWCHDYLSCRLCSLYLRFSGRAHFRTYGARACEELLAEAGFSAISVERYRISWLWGMMTASARLGAKAC